MASQTDDQQTRKFGGLKHQMYAHHKQSLQGQNLLDIISKPGVRNIFLLFAVALYSYAGGLMFCSLEKSFQTQEWLSAVNSSRDDVVRKTENLILLGETINDIFENLTKDLEDIDMAFEGGMIPMDDIEWNRNRTQILFRRSEDIREAVTLYNEINNCTKAVPPSAAEPWSIWEGIFYAWTLYSTIGYGNYYCKTTEGRALTIVYSLIGIPLLITLLNEWGHFIFNLMVWSWNRFLYLINLLMIKRKKHYARQKSVVASLAVVPAGPDWESPFKTNSSGMEESKDVPMSLVLMIFLFWMCFSAFVQYLMELEAEESWTYFTSFYFVFITLTTIGLGDECPSNAKNSVLSLLLVLIFLSIISMSLSVVQYKIESLFTQMLDNIDKEYKAQLAKQQNGDVSGDGTGSDAVKGKMETMIHKRSFKERMLFKLMDQHKKKLLEEHIEECARMRHIGIQCRLLDDMKKIQIPLPPPPTLPRIEEESDNESIEDSRPKRKGTFKKEIYIYNI